MILYYALGGGLGHLTRARKVLGAPSATPSLLTASEHARDPRVTGGLPVIPVPRRLGPRPRRVPRLAARACSPTCSPTS